LREALNTYPLETSDDIRKRTLIDLGYKWDRNRCPSEFQAMLDPSYPTVIINTNSLPGMEEVSLGVQNIFCQKLYWQLE